MPTPDYVEVFERKDGKYGWRRRNGNNTEIVSTDGGQGYENLNYCVEQARKVNQGMSVHRVVDVEDDPYTVVDPFAPKPSDNKPE